MRETGPQATSILADVRILLSERAGGAAARDQVYAALREAIVSAELEPGRKLSENELAELLGVSRTPVREALARLRDDRLVAIVPQLGTFVTLISDEAIADAAFVREALECSAIRLATERATPAQLEELQANLAAQERAEQEGDVDAFDALDASLHRSLCELSGRDIEILCASGNGAAVERQIVAIAHGIAEIGVGAGRSGWRLRNAWGIVKFQKGLDDIQKAKSRSKSPISLIETPTFDFRRR